MQSRLGLRSTILLCALAATAATAQEGRWWKGNLHTHTLWSDGDDYPEMVLDWYKSRGWHFVAMSDHNILNRGQKWVHPQQALDDVPMQQLARYRERFGDDWVEIDEGAGQLAVRLRAIDEYRPLFEEEERFLVIQAEEITENFGSKPVHLNATNLEELIDRQGGETLLDVYRRNIDAVYAQRERTGRPMFPHLNHPNFRWGLTLEEFIAIENESFFEVYNGHPGVYNDGGPNAASMDELWDHALAARLTGGGRILYGLAVDDGHVYSRMSTSVPNPGRGWVMVRAQSLDIADLIEALERGDFYSSSGVELAELRQGEEGISLRIVGEDRVGYTTLFIGTRRGADGRPAEIGEVLAVEQGLEASYRFRGDELYVRARVVSTKPKQNPYRAGEVERAWTQPVQPR
jgi:hypothetical protein